MSAAAASNKKHVEPARRFYFDINDGTEVRDEIGRCLEGGSILRAEALRVMTRLAAAEAEDAKETTLALTVRDQAGETALRVRLICQIELP